MIDKDVSIDHAAAQEMVQKSGQMGVPVIVAGEQVIVGFDRPALEQIAQRYAAALRPKLGLTVRDTSNGVEVGTVRPGGLGERAGVKTGDILADLNEQPVHSVADVEQIAAGLPADTR
ncbi:MAG TPA: PDZ domain-containing protein, partial [Chloroflexota bacterium]|nr:PDZ domain-containing protein [Chloroflexota bacterium]